MPDRVQLTVDDAIATVRMNRDDKLNALDWDMFEGLIRCGKRIMANHAIRAVVLHGEGRAFCSGLDFPSFMGRPDLMKKLLARDDAGAESRSDLAQDLGARSSRPNEPAE